MKIGIVSIYDLTNYGNRLQNFALEHYLRKMGAEADTIISKSGFFKLCTALEIKPKLKKQKQKIFKSFNEHCVHEKFFKKPKDAREKYDFFVVGSDQIWNPLTSFYNNVKFLEFADKEKCIAYAPSFGLSKPPRFYKRFYKRGLNHIDHLSVREEAGAKIIKGLIGKEAQVLIDPTMLLSHEEWQNFAGQERLEKEDYLLTYFLGKTKNHKKHIENFAKKNNLKIINLNDKSDKKTFLASPQEFVNLIFNAKIIFTDSFHGTVFSILGQRPFVVCDRDGFQNFLGSRIKTLLKLTNFESRYSKNLTEEEFLKIDFAQANKNIEAEREKSKKFLENALKTKKGI